MSALVPAANTEFGIEAALLEIIAGARQQGVGACRGRRRRRPVPWHRRRRTRSAWKSTSVPSLSNRIARDVGQPSLRPAQSLDLANQAGRRGIVAVRRSPCLRRPAAAPVASSLPSSTPHWSKELMPNSCALDEDAVLVERDQPAERVGVELAVDEGHRRPVAGEDLVRGERARPPRRHALAPASALAPPPACGPSSAPRDCARQLASSRSWWSRQLRLVAVGGDQELDRDDVGALVQQLEEGVLAVGARLAPDQRAGRRRRPACRRASTRLPFDSMSSCCR